jgi:hypothetical protein
VLHLRRFCIFTNRSPQIAMRHLFFLTLLLATFCAQSQHAIVVDTVTLTETIDNSVVSQLPRVRDTSGRDSKVVEKINSFLLEKFMINSFNQRELTEFRWYDVSFTSEIKENRLFIAFAGEYYGAYPTNVEEEMLFDLGTGDNIQQEDIPFEALFTLKGYTDFLNRYWLTSAKGAFQKAMECAGDIDPYCSYYDIDWYEIKNGWLYFSLTSDCFPHVARACAPDIMRSMPVDSLRQYLNPTGKKALLDDAYTNKYGIDKCLYNQKMKDELPTNLFFFGKVDSQHAFTMAINLDKSSDKVAGYYYYDDKLQPLMLTGRYTPQTITLTETVNKRPTGKFELKIDREYKKGAYNLHYNQSDIIYLSCSWSDPAGKASLPVTFDECKVTGSLKRLER